MDNYLYHIFKVFYSNGEDSFENINDSNREIFVDNQYVLAAAHLVQGIYFNKYDFFKFNKCYLGDTREVNCVKYDLIKDKNGNAVLVIRGTSNICNWMTNFNVGSWYLLNFLINALSFFLIFMTISFLIKTVVPISQAGYAIVGIASLVGLLYLNIKKSELISRNNIKIYHKSYNEIAKRIITQILNDNDDVKKILLIGHSMSGGIIEEILVSPIQDITLKAICFNSAISRIGHDDREEMTRKSIQISYLFDLLTIVNAIFILPINKKIIKATKIKSYMCIMFILILLNVMNLFIFNSSTIVSENYFQSYIKFMLDIYLFVSLWGLAMMSIFLITQTIRAIFVNNHLMNFLIEELDKM